jgi:coenzyme F420-reducing hydrogenase alpha subunit
MEIKEIMFRGEPLTIALGKKVSIDITPGGRDNRITHVKKHGINMDLQELVNFADRTRGVVGVHTFEQWDRSEITVIIDKPQEEDWKNYGILKTMWRHDAKSRMKKSEKGSPMFYHPLYSQDKAVPTCEKHGTIPYAHGWCPFCDFK